MKTCLKLEHKLPVDVRRSKTAVLKFSNSSSTLTSWSLHLNSSFLSFPRSSTTFSKYFDNRDVASPGERLLSLFTSPSRSLSVRSWPLFSSSCLLAIPSFLNSMAASRASIPSSSSISLEQNTLVLSQAKTSEYFNVYTIHCSR